MIRVSLRGRLEEHLGIIVASIPTLKPLWTTSDEQPAKTGAAKYYTAYTPHKPSSYGTRKSANGSMPQGQSLLLGPMDITKTSEFRDSSKVEQDIDTMDRQSINNNV